MHKLKKIFSKGVLVCVVASLLFAQTAQAFVSDPVISNLSAVPNKFNPKNSQSTTLTFNLNTSAYYTIEVLSQPNQNVVKRVVSNKLAPSAGDFSESWNGRNTAGQIVAKGTYTVKVAVQNSEGDDTAWTSVTVDYDEERNNPPAVTLPEITNVSAVPKTINPRNGQSSTITFHLNKSAKYNMDILKNGVVIDTITNTKNAPSAGDYSESWDGRSSGGAYVEEGAYMARVKAQNDAGWSVPAYTIIYVDYPTPVDPTPVPPVGNVPAITNDYASPNPFNPDNQTTRIYYTLNTTAKVTVTVLSGGDTVTLKSSQTEDQGTHSVEWGGRNAAGNIVGNGTHIYKVIAQNDYGYDVELGTVSAQKSTTPPSSINVTGVYADPYSFNPTIRNTKLHYSIDGYATVNVSILKDNVSVKDVTLQSSKGPGAQSEAWDGRNQWGEYVTAGTYTFRVTATSGGGSDTEYGTVEVYYEQNEGPTVYNAFVTPHPYDPTIHGDANVYYEIDRRARVTVNIKELGGAIRKTIIDDVWAEGGEHYKKWNGKDKNGNYLAPGVYILYVKANNGFGSDVLEVQVYLGSGGIIIKGDMCAGFYDVPANSPYCLAITEAKRMGIFDGYSDGTFRPYQPINRAETVKVVLKALNRPILPPDGTDLGFRDIVRNAWYMPYLKTGRMYGVIHGYPDGSFRPSHTINRVELLKVFLNATGMNIPACVGRPYPDVPGDNPWYLRFACFAKQYDLVNPDGYGNLQPGTPMTRGDVANLFYRFQSQGLFGAEQY